MDNLHKPQNLTVKVMHSMWNKTTFPTSHIVGIGVQHVGGWRNWAALPV